MMVDYENMNPTRKRVYKYMYKNKVTQGDMYTILGFNSRQAFGMWMKGVSRKHDDRINAIMDGIE